MFDATHIKSHQDACRYLGDPAAQGLGKTKGGRDLKLNCVVNRDGKPISFTLMPGNRHEVLTAKECLGDFAEAFFLTDKGYDIDDFRAFIQDAGGVVIIPPNKNRLHPIFYDKEIGKERRKVENYFCRLKRFRRI